MTFLPIVARELRIAARRPSTFWVRSGAALAILIIGTWFFLMNQGQPTQVIALGLFSILTGSAVLYCLLSGVWFTADCLSEEKREGTLGLLFLTDLKGYDVVFGKLAATSLNGFYAVLATVPILALPLLLGGVTGGEFGRMALVVVNTLFFSLALGICVSAMSRSPRKAMAMTFLLILLFTAMLPACGAWRSVAVKAPQVAKAWLMPSTGFSYCLALDVFYKTRAPEFWWSVAVIHGLGWIFLLVASFIAPRSWQDQPAGAQTLRWRERWRWWSYGNVAERAAFRRRLLDQSAYFWLAARARLKPAYVWAVLGLVACGWVWGLARSGRDWLHEMTYVLTGLLLNLLIKVWFALEAGRPLAEDRRQGAFELLLSTPLTENDILRGQLLALKRQFRGPVVVVLTVFFLFAMAASSDALSQQEPQDQILWVLFWAAAMVMLVADLMALYWVGMWEGLTARNPTRAATANLGRIMALPWIALGFGVLVASVAWPNTDETQGQKLFLGLWFGLGLAADLGFGAWARHRLLTEFRLAATRRYELLPGFWKRLLSGGGPASVAVPQVQRLENGE
jgi:ABC-type transport system involved in multi-copper enzyme maturation permease subunit